MYMSFPFRVGPDGPRLSARAAHVREQIEQVLLTDPGERIFRPNHGAGLRTLAFEPMGSPLWAVTQKRLVAALMDTLAGEVDPKTIDVKVRPAENEEAGMLIEISYTLAALGLAERHVVPLAGGSNNG
jgi:phage baseplate assembly protein W